VILFVHRGHAVGPPAAMSGGARGSVVVLNASSDLYAEEHFVAGTRILDPEPYVPPSARGAALAAAFSYAETWDAVLPERVRHYRGVRLSEGAVLEALGVFAEICGALALAQRVLAAERPARVALVADGSPAAAAWAHAARRVCPVVELPAPATGPAVRPSIARLIVRCAVARMTSGGRTRAAASSRVLLADYPRFAPIVGGLGSHADVDVVVLSASARGGRVLEETSRRLVLPAYLSVAGLVRVARYARSAAAAVRGISREAAPRVFGEEVLEVARPWMERTVRHAFPDHAATVEMVYGAVARERLTHVIVNQDQEGTLRVLSLAAESLGVHTICYQHGMTPRFHVPDHVSRTVAVWGEEERRMYREAGRASASRMRLVGDPALASGSNVAADRRSVCRALGLDPDRPVVLVALERYIAYHAADEWRQTHNRRLARCCEAATRLGRPQLLFRFKPARMYDEFGDPLRVKHAIIERFNTGNLFVDTGGPLADRLQIADAAIVEYSTVGLEAMRFGVPVVVLGDPESEDLTHYVTSGAALRANTTDEIASAITQVLNDAAVRSRLAAAQERFVRASFCNLRDSDRLARLRGLLLESEQTRATLPATATA
jgi:glycosyltransferase involved in cell wall biosynthesis